MPIVIRAIDGWGVMVLGYCAGEKDVAGGKYGVDWICSSTRIVVLFDHSVP